MVLASITFWLSATVIRLERYHYASVTGMCPLRDNTMVSRWEQDECLRHTETQTSPLWHLYYGMKDGI